MVWTNEEYIWDSGIDPDQLAETRELAEEVIELLGQERVAAHLTEGVGEFEILTYRLSALTGISFLSLYDQFEGNIDGLRGAVNVAQRAEWQRLEEETANRLADEMRTEIDGDIIDRITNLAHEIEENADGRYVTPDPETLRMMGVDVDAVHHPTDFQPIRIPLERTQIGRRERYLQADWTMETGRDFDTMYHPDLENIIKKEIETENMQKALPPDDLFDMDK